MIVDVVKKKKRGEKSDYINCISTFEVYRRVKPAIKRQLKTENVSELPCVIFSNPEENYCCRTGINISIRH